MTSLWLPPELIEMVLDHLHSDKRTLAACSVVCKAWIHPARSRLFAEIYLKPTSFKKFFESGSAGIPFIRHLRIGGWINHSLWNENIPHLVGFESIKSLSLEYLPWRAIFPETQLSLQTHSAAITCLRLIEIKVYLFSELAEVICTFRQLETLVMDGIRWGDPDMPSPSLSLSDKLRALEVQGCGLDLLLEWLLSLERTPALRTVYLHESNFDGINGFLKAMGISLEVLLCGIDIYDGIFKVDWPVNLNYNTRLQVLRIKLYKPNGMMNDTRKQVTQWVTRILSQIASEHMNRVVFEVYFRDYLHYLLDNDQRDLLEWTEVDSILALSQFSRLKNIDIIVLKLFGEYPSEQLDLSTWHIAHLPRCHARGILRIRLDKWKPTRL